jgi:lipopolysaccharide assembly protein A
MRYIYIFLIVAVSVVVLTFKIQNLTVVTVSLFGASLTMSVSLLTIGVYILGMLTGSALLGLVRGWVKGARGR